jgi:hypothetical protein
MIQSPFTLIFPQGKERCKDRQGKCWESIPYQQLRFALATGALVERVDLATKLSFE